MMVEKRQPRQDQLRNRAKLLEAAEEVFETEGLDARIEEIADRAGVGTTTFYRHFPTKDELLAALLDQLGTGALDVAADAEKRGDPWQAFVAVFTEACVLPPSRVVLFDQIARQQSVLAERARTMTAKIVGGVVRRAKEAGALRKDVTVDDVANLMRMMNSEPDRGRRRKFVTILLAGLRSS